MMRKVLWLIILLSFTGLPFVSAQNVTIHTLSSGKQIKILGEGRINFTDSAPALMLKYETNINISDVASLRVEAQEIMKDFKYEVEKNGYTSAILSANQPSNGGIISFGKMYNFVFIKNKAGEWLISK